jgi:hypothetical protein
LPEIQVKDKLITLEELGTAINAKAGVTSVNSQTGAVSITPANIGALDVNGSNAMYSWMIIDASANNGLGIDIAMSNNRHWYLYPTDNGDAFAIAGNDGTNWFSALNVSMITKKVSLPRLLDVTSGGTGATNAFSALQNLFDVDGDAIAQYPNKPGVYWTTSYIFRNMNPSSPYGILVIIKSGYGMHLYLDANTNLYIGFSGNVFEEPSTWKIVTSTVQS